ncbi:hypothetical protein F2Q69_00001379 [Brassica cretica]|uniref:Uncharacterized protein n=1 Tax=Brassica cretica TaxID=69181 RepID=A0A8S9NZK9_BRACR|nr:hypothetical protein F2Q69_00001379 [Brassica cretica]
MLVSDSALGFLRRDPSKLLVPPLFGLGVACWYEFDLQVKQIWVTEFLRIPCARVRFATRGGSKAHECSLSLLGPRGQSLSGSGSALLRNSKLFG